MIGLVVTFAASFGAGFFLGRWMLCRRAAELVDYVDRVTAADHADRRRPEAR